MNRMNKDEGVPELHGVCPYTDESIISEQVICEICEGLHLALQIWHQFHCALPVTGL